MNIVFKRLFICFLSALFLFTIFFVLTFFNGYEFDLKKIKFVRTGSLYIETLPKSSNLYLNNKKFKETTPLIINHLSPNKYNIRIEKAGYKTWEDEIEINSGEVSFFEYEMIRDDINLTYLQNLSDNYFISDSEQYIIYSFLDLESSFYNVYLYDFENNVNTKIYELKNELEDVIWGAASEILFLKDNKNNFFYYDFIDITNIYDKISINIKNIYPNLTNKNEIILESSDNIFILDLYSYNLKKIELKEPYSKLLFHGNNILIINENSIKIFNKENLNLINEFSIQGLKTINFINDFYVILDYRNNLHFLNQDFQEFFKTYANKYKYNKNHFLIFNNNEIKLFNINSNSEILLSRYGNSILDANFYKDEYILYYIENNLILKNIKYNNNIYLINDLDNLNDIININNNIYIIKKIDGKNILFRVKL
ncbi:PEGA domain-containing protein [Patescibacteria group bacterium]|nr:PEGA domain-containing protein [Patescibacteria group bacterium]